MSKTCEYCNSTFSRQNVVYRHYQTCKMKILHDQKEIYESQLQNQRERHEQEIQNQKEVFQEKLNIQEQIYEKEIQSLKNQISQLFSMTNAPEKIINQIKSQTETIQQLINRNTILERQILDQSKCHHGIRKSTCRECFGSEICLHKKRKTTCSKCDPIGHLAHVCRSRIYSALKQEKTCSTIEYLGCSIQELKTYLESKFEEGMNWDNHGTEWHVDHIVPIRYESPDDIATTVQRLHYTNLQPLWASENYIKGNRWVG